jgi:hypothetical protein
MNDKPVMIVNDLPEFKEDQKSKKSLRQRIKESRSNEEVQELLKIGSTYKKASVKTLKTWAKAAALKFEQLKSK